MEVMHGEAVCTSVLGVPTLRVSVACRPAASAAAPVPAPDPLCIYLALDRSGSMMGDPLAAAKLAVCGFAQHAAAAGEGLGLVALDLLLFDHRVQSMDLLGLGPEEIEQQVGGIDAQGGTCFSTVLGEIQRRVLAAPAARHFVAFFTDGQDYGQVPAAEAVQQFRAATREARLAVHCLGFGRSHDAAFLSSLTLAGSDQGSFQYLEDTAAIEGSMDRVVQELEEYAGRAGGSCLSATLHLGPCAAVAAAAPDGAAAATSAWQRPAAPSSGLSRAVVLKAVEAKERQEEGEAEGEQRAICDEGKEGNQEQDVGMADGDVDAGPAASQPRIFHCHVELTSTAHLEAAEEALAIEVPLGGRVALPLRREEAALGEAAGMALALVKRRAIEWTNQLATCQLSRGEMEVLRDAELAPMRRELAGMQARTRELLPLGRHAYRAARSQLLEAAGLANRFECEVLAEALNGTLSNHHIASLNHQAYQLLDSAALKKGLAKRVGQNLDLAEEVEAAVAAAVEKLQQRPGGLEGLPPAEEFGRCAISCLDYWEALEAGDCLCLGLDIERPEAAVMDPSRLVIKSIAPTRLTADSFMDALRFSLGQQPSSPQAVHGGFGRGVAAQVMAGEGREAITGALPLFICPEHWSVAALQAKPLLGWMTTLSPLGYSEEQLRVVPFLVLARALRDLQGEGGGNGEGGTAFRAWVAQQALQTCRAVYRQRRRRLLAGLLLAEKEGQDQQEGEEEEKSGAGTKGAPSTAAAGGDGGEQQGRQCLQYLAGGPAARTTDAVPSAQVFLMHLMCASLEGDVALTPEDWRQLRLAVAEEELRRCQRERADAAALLGVDAQQACAAVLAKWSGSHPEAAASEATPALAELEAIARELSAGVDWAAQLATLAGRPGVAAQQHAYEKRVRPLLQLLAAAEQQAGDGASGRGGNGSNGSSSDSQAAASQQPQPLWQPLERLADWVGSPATAALLLQNGDGLKNADRREYVAEGHYVDPFHDPEALLRRHWGEAVWAAVRDSMSDLRNATYLRAATAMSERFAAAASLEAAADAIQGWRLGRPFVVHLLLSALRQPGTAQPTEKMRLLLDGGLGGRVLRGDKHGGSGSGAAAAAVEMEVDAPGEAPGQGQGIEAAAAAVPAEPEHWVPSRSNVYSFLRAHHHHVPLEQALQLFGHCHGVDEAYLRMQYAAGFDPTSPLTHRRSKRNRRQRGDAGVSGSRKKTGAGSTAKRCRRGSA